MSKYSSPETQIRLLQERMQDLAGKALRQGSGFAAGPFFTPEEIAAVNGAARKAAKETGLSVLFFGGYATAERQVPLFYDSSLYPEETLPYLCGILALEIRPRGNQKATKQPLLHHRALLGSLMALGLSRESIGDLIPFGEDGSFVCFARETVAAFLREQLTRVGSEAVDCYEIQLSPDYCPILPSEELRDTVASLRLDCLLAALLHISRDKAKTLIEDGLAMKNHIPVKDPSEPFREGDRITVRHYGRFDILAANEEDRTRKGRIRLVAKKYL